jgi:hypothetical protein
MLFRAKVIAPLFPDFHSHSKLKNILKTFGDANPLKNFTSIPLSPTKEALLTF